MGNCCKRRSDREVIDGSNYVLCDDTLILVFNYLSLRERFPLRRVSKQFDECIEESLKMTKQLTFKGSDEDKKRKKLKKRLNIYSITIQIASIDSLVLRGCYINETIIRFFNENIKNLKSLSLIGCRIDSFSELLSSNQMKIFSKKPIDLIIDDYYYTLKDNQLLDFIQLFENAVKLTLYSEYCSNLEKLFERLNPSVNCIWVDTVYPVHHFTNFLFETLLSC